MVAIARMITMVAVLEREAAWSRIANGKAIRRSPLSTADGIWRAASFGISTRSPLRRAVRQQQHDEHQYVGMRSPAAGAKWDGDAACTTPQQVRTTPQSCQGRR